MKEKIKKAMLIGIGLGEITKARAEKIAQDLLKKGQASNSEMKKFAMDIYNKANQQQKKVREQTEKSMAKVLKRSEIEIDNVSKKIKGLQKKSQGKKKQPGFKTPPNVQPKKKAASKKTAKK